MDEGFPPPEYPKNINTIRSDQEKIKELNQKLLIQGKLLADLRGQVLNDKERVIFLESELSSLKVSTDTLSVDVNSQSQMKIEHLIKQLSECASDLEDEKRRDLHLFSM